MFKLLVGVSRIITNEKSNLKFTNCDFKCLGYVVNSYEDNTKRYKSFKIIIIVE